MLSVIIPTKDRPQKINLCLESILSNSYKDFEIIIVDQSYDNKTKKIVDKINSSKISYLKLSFRNKSKAVNQAIKVAKGKILTFTDDDVVVDKFWLERIKVFFDENKKNQQVVGVFGQVLPYKPKKHQNEVCPSTFTLKRKALISDRHIISYKKLGLSSNMSLDKEALLKIGCFREWVGPGSLCGGSDDGELIYRFLKNNCLLAYDPDIRVAHNRWLNYQDWRTQQGVYTCGEITFCLHYFLRGDFYMGKIILNKIMERVFNSDLKKAVKRLLKIDKNWTFSYLKDFLRELIFSGWQIFSIVKGFLIGAFLTNRN